MEKMKLIIQQKSQTLVWAPPIQEDSHLLAFLFVDILLELGEIVNCYFNNTLIL